MSTNVPLCLASMRLALLTLITSALLAVGVGPVAVDRASAHRHGCHRSHTCPSDHATYRWHGLLCVARYSDKYNSSFNRRVRYGGRTYHCKR